MTKPVVVIGGGGHAKVVIATLRAMNITVGGVLDDDTRLWDTSLLGVPVTGPIRREAAIEGPVVLAIGRNESRKMLAQQLPCEWATVVHPRAWVDPTAILGPGTVVLAGAIVQADAIIGAHVIVNTGATVDHDCVIGDYVHLAPGVNLAGSVEVGEGAFLGIGSTAIPGVCVGEWARAGAGAVIVRDVPRKTLCLGVPARATSRV